MGQKESNKEKDPFPPNKIPKSLFTFAQTRKLTQLRFVQTVRVCWLRSRRIFYGIFSKGILLKEDG